MTPLFPWRPAILSPTWSLRFMATKTLTVLFTPGASSSPFARSATRSALTFLMTSICESVRWRMSRTWSRISSSFSLSPLSMRGVIWPIFSIVQLAALLDENVALRVGHVLEDGAPREERLDLLLRLRADDADLVVGVLREAADLLVEDLLGPDVLLLLLVLAREDLHLHDDALDARGALERGVAHVAGLLAEDRAEELLLGRELRLALRRDLADEDVVRA